MEQHAPAGRPEATTFGGARAVRAGRLPHCGAALSCSQAKLRVSQDRERVKLLGLAVWLPFSWRNRSLVCTEKNCFLFAYQIIEV